MDCQPVVINTLGIETYIPPDPTADFFVPDSICPGATATIINNSSFGCTDPPSVNPNYNSSSANFNNLAPSFFYDWGNCSTATYIPTPSQYNSNNYTLFLIV